MFGQHRRFGDGVDRQQCVIGDHNVGSGGDTQNGITLSYVNPVTGQAATYAEDFFGSGILINILSREFGTLPGVAAKRPNL